MFICQMCGKQSETPLYGKGLFCSKSCQAKFAFKKASQARTKKCSEKKLEKEQKLLEEKRTTRCICEKCKKEYFLIDGFSKRFCSSSCAHFRVFTVHKVMTAEAKQKISAGLKKYFSENRLAGSKANVNRPKRQLPEIAIEHTRQAALKKDKSYITDEYRKKMSENAKAFLASGKIKPWQSRKVTSYAEKFWMKVLDNNDIKYEREVKIKHEKSNYFLDFLIEINHVKIDLEIDGKQHQYEDRALSDSIRDKFLMNEGFLVYRIKWNNLNTKSGSLLIKEKIDGFLSFYRSLEV